MTAGTSNQTAAVDAAGYRTLREVAHEQARLHQIVGAGSVLGEIGDRVAARITASLRVRGTGRDLVSAAQPGWQRLQNPEGIENGERRRYDLAAREWKLPERRRYQQWRNAPERIGEVKTRQLVPGLGRDQSLDTRGAGPTTPYYPLVDFCVFVIFDDDGDIAMARRLELAELLDFAAGTGPRGGWNYKLAITLDMTDGEDLTVAARTALRTLSPDVGARPRRMQ